MKKLLQYLSLLAALGALAGASLNAQPETLAPGEIVWAHGTSGELEKCRAELENMLRRYGDKHPQVVELKNNIAVLEARAPWVLSFDFPGGSISKFLAQISKANVVSFNVVSSDPANLTVELPPFSLRNANLGTIAEVLGNLLGSKGYDFRHAGGDKPDPNEANSLVSVLTKRPGMHSENQPPPTLFDSFPLGAYLTDQSIDDIVGAIRAGWELDPKHDRDALRLKFHPPTAILLVSGPPEAIMVASKVISQLKGAFDKDSKSGLHSSQHQPPPTETKR